jgi:lysophospholipase L1-like esterase
VRVAAFAWLAALNCAAAIALPTAARAAPGPWTTDRPHKAVVIGGSISKYYAGNFGQFLHYGCKDLEVINRGEVGAGAAKLLGNLQSQVINQRALLQAMSDGKGWILLQGGLNSVGAPESTIWSLTRLIAAAHAAGLKVLALTVTPWGADDDPRFDGWNGLRLHRATEQVAEALMGKLTPARSLGRRAVQRGGDAQTWQADELADLTIDLWHSALRVGSKAPLRPAEPLRDSFASSPWRKFADQRDQWVEAARAVPRQFMDGKYRDFDHVHPNTAGHKLMAALACQQAPAEWRCDCDAIRRARWKGKVLAGTEG